ncbi:MAG: superoxide dismutase [Phycisphaerales bacterium JB040]
MPHELPDLPYEHTELEPMIDSATMRLHHGKHHAGYVRTLNDTLRGSGHEETPLDELLLHAPGIDPSIRQTVIDAGGGHFNHSLFWRCLAPPGSGGEPEGEIRTGLESAFGSLTAFRDEFTSTATGRFGSGWAWLCVRPNGTLACVSTANQNPCFLAESLGGHGPESQPILGLDVWEHAYYLRYHNERARYIEAWWNVVNWHAVSEHLERVRATGSALPAPQAA